MINHSQTEELLREKDIPTIFKRQKLTIIVILIVAALLWIGSCLGLYFILRQPASLMQINTVVTQKAPKPLGPYSAGRSYGDLLFVAGQIGINPQQDKILSNNVTEQTQQALTNLKNILLAGGSNLDRVLYVTIYLMNSMDDFASVNEVYSKFFTNDQQYPARATVVVKQLPLKNGVQSLVEIAAVAVKA